MNHNEIPEKPILMSAPMVKATLADIKTNTRRLTGLGSVNECPDHEVMTKLAQVVKKMNKKAAH